MNALLDQALAAHPGSSPVDLLMALLVIGLVPALAMSVTSFTRVLIVLSLLRTAIGAPAVPPNMVLAALALMLTCTIMAPTFDRVMHVAIEPYAQRRLSPSQAIEKGAEPVREFMAKHARPADVAAFARMQSSPEVSPQTAPLRAVAPAFLVGELRAAFAMGFALALPFAVIDIVVSSILMSLGMYMVSPAAISLPLKLLLFVVADGWSLVAGALVASYR